ncbi:MAG: OmpA family protein [Gemmataceae bacterium]|nr:OmpA family protein [Gemmataceae bacterium]MCI0737450.1 OmpA family protein [Gemmataceae bacterium]
MVSRIGKPFIETNAIRKARLTDFATGKADLQPEHRAWLDDLAALAGQQRYYYVDIVGFASKTGSVELNQKLSEERVASVLHYLEVKDERILKRVRHLEFMGEGSYQAPESDNSADWRAVEVHFYNFQPRAPKGTNPSKPVPGGPRYADWSTTAVFGVQFNILPGIVVAANLVMFRKNETPVEEHWYLVPQFGFGFNVSPPAKLGLINQLRRIFGPKKADVIESILGSANYSGVNLTRFTALTPFNFDDLVGATCDIASGGAGVGGGAQLALMSVRGKIWWYDRYGRLQRGMQDYFTNVSVGGPTAMYGGSASVVGGPLLLMS